MPRHPAVAYLPLVRFMRARLLYCADCDRICRINGDGCHTDRGASQKVVSFHAETRISICSSASPYRRARFIPIACPSTDWLGEECHGRAQHRLATPRRRGSSGSNTMALQARAVAINQSRAARTKRCSPERRLARSRPSKFHDATLDLTNRWSEPPSGERFSRWKTED